MKSRHPQIPQGLSRSMIQFNFIYIVSVTIMVSRCFAFTQSLTPEQETVARKDSLITGRKLEQAPFGPSCSTMSAKNHLELSGPSTFFTFETRSSLAEFLSYRCVWPIWAHISFFDMNHLNSIFLHSTAAFPDPTWKCPTGDLVCAQHWHCVQQNTVQETKKQQAILPVLTVVTSTRAEQKMSVCVSEFAEVCSE